MAKIKTFEHKIATVRCRSSQWTNWETIREQGVYEYGVGECYVPQGLITLFHQPIYGSYTRFYANARIIHDNKVYELFTHDECTRVGWVRIVKKWAKKFK